mmetsp:Transcript_28568/g.80522  ORF Transcript_28568/g.80522 Transcript_28568/m.80522 type:complete len:117 (-) Transcript_28568:1942-2292(-)
MHSSLPSKRMAPPTHARKQLMKFPHMCMLQYTVAETVAAVLCCSDGWLPACAIASMDSNITWTIVCSHSFFRPSKHGHGFIQQAHGLSHAAPHGTGSYEYPYLCHHYQHHHHEQQH